MNGSAKMMQRTIAGLTVLVIVLAFLLPAQPARAVWEPLLWENWERPVGTPFPWSTSGHPWLLYPGPGMIRWDVERGAIYHPGAPDAISSVWCVGSHQGLQPGVDPYPSNVYTHLYWGPFSLEDAAEANGSLWLWADMEENANGTGDFFYLGIKQGGFSSSLSQWDFLYKNDVGGTDSDWDMVLFDFDEVISGEDTVSYLGMDNLLISLIFSSDYDDINGLGVFVDDISMGFDNGMFDFELTGLELVNPDDPSQEFEFLFADQPVQAKIDFKAHGNFVSNVVDHVLYANNNPVSVITDSWEGSVYGQSYSVLFDDILTPQQPGEVDITVFLDAQMEQPEADETNNDSTRTYTIFAENTPPWIEFIHPDADSDTTTGEWFDIVYEAYNSPVQEEALMTFFVDVDNEGNDGQLIENGFNLTVPNAQDTLGFYIDPFQYGDYWLYAKLDDGYHDPVYTYSEGPIHYMESAVDERAPASRPSEFRVVSACPNPFNPTVDITLALPAPGDVEANWYSVDGRLVDQRDFGRLSAGEHSFSWTPDNLPSGLYLLQVNGPNGVATHKVTYLK